MNYTEVVEHLKSISDNVSEFAYGKFPVELGETEQVFSNGGEGKGEDWERVYHFKKYNIFISFTGFYSSYNGTDFDGWSGVSQVYPKEKTITVYE